MKHTPGPWETRRNPAWSKDVDIGQVGKFQNLAFVSSLNEDDARLIAAAPDLLEALKDARFALYGNGVGNPKIDAAIAKAEGKEGA